MAYNCKGTLTLLLPLLVNEPGSDAVHAYVGFMYFC